MEIFSYAGESGKLHENYNMVKELTQAERAHCWKAPTMQKANIL